MIDSLHKSPRILFLGAELRAIGLMDVYGLANRPDFILTDRHAPTGKELNGYKVTPFNDLSLADVEVALITENPIGEYLEAIDFLKKNGISSERIITCGEPGKAHRALTRLAPVSSEYNRHLGYLAIRRNLYHRGNYAYCMILAAEAALRMNLTKATAIEFGVWYGSGLKNMCEIADFIHQTIGVEFRIFGFDTGTGLPEIADWRDHPELWGSGSLVMPNFEELSSQLPSNCKLIIGNCRDTLEPFLHAYGTAEAPVAFISLDVDQYHSSVSALKIFDADPMHLMPVVPIWVDDSYLNVLQTTYAGEGLAIREFNDRHDMRKIEQKIIRTDDYPRLWHHCIYFAHIFDHPVRQGKMEARFDGFFHTNY